MVQLAKKNVDKSSKYNRKYYNRKAKAVEIVVGDQVLMRNVQERARAGEMRIYWEGKIFKEVEKCERLPVYKIRSLKDSRDTHVVYWKLLLKLDQLPVDVFDEEDNVGKKN